MEATHDEELEQMQIDLPPAAPAEDAAPGEDAAPAECDPGPMIILESTQDGETFSVRLSAASVSDTIRALACMPERGPAFEEEMRDWTPPVGAIPLPPVKADTLARVVVFMDHVHDNPAESEVDKQTWIDAFLDTEDGGLFDIIRAANYLEIKELLDFGCKRVGAYITACQTPQAIRRRFNILNDFTPEVRRYAQTLR